MLSKIKWNFISDAARERVFKDLEDFNEERKLGNKPKYILEKLFKYYNEYVSHKYPKVGSSLSCGHCVSHVTRLFQGELEKWQTVKK